MDQRHNDTLYSGLALPTCNDLDKQAKRNSFETSSPAMVSVQMTVRWLEDSLTIHVAVSRPILMLGYSPGTVESEKSLLARCKTNGLVRNVMA
jgi:hypothetical protein